MQQLVARTQRSACPHDCPSGCSLDVTVDNGRIGRISGARDNTYTAGIVCAKVARYAERTHHPDRLTTPLHRTGAKGSGRFEPITWDDALDTIADAFRRAAATHGAEAVWPYQSGGTMGQVQRMGLERLRNVMGYSRQQSTICMAPAEAGWRAGIGALKGADPREMSESDLIVMWGGNPVSTQVNVMTHVTRARKERGARLAVIDVYRTPTVEQADIALIINPGTDGALALAMMCVILREGLADREYLARYTDFDAETERHILTRTPEWAAALTGLEAQQIVDFARLYAATPRAFLRLGFGFTRTRNGAAAMHAVSALPAVTGSWKHRGGGAFFVIWDKTVSGIDTTTIQGLDVLDLKVRNLDQSRIGAILGGDRAALKGGPPVMAMLMQNANSADVAPDTGAVRRGLSREDLFLAVHEQFMTPTAALADIVLPATTFLEHDDLYVSYGHTHLALGVKVIDPIGEARSNHDVVCALASRLGARHRGFEMTARELIDSAMRPLGGLAEITPTGFMDRAEPFEAAHFLNGFPQPGGRFRFKPDWRLAGPDVSRMPTIVDWMSDYERAGDVHPLKLVTPPARHFLNSSFTETPTSTAKEGGDGPRVLIHPETARAYAISDGATVRLGNTRGEVVLKARIADGQRPGTLVVEGIWPSDAFANGRGINTLVGEDPVPPNGGVAFHDIAVWIKPA